jgi:hypothetical protein
VRGVDQLLGQYGHSASFRLRRGQG